MMGDAMTTRLAAALVAYRRGLAAALFVATLVVGFAVVMAATVRDSTMSAAIDSIIAQRGFEEGWAIQATDDQAAQVLSASPSLTSTATTNVSVLTSRRASRARLTVLSDVGPRIGVLVDGRRADVVREVVISRALADALVVKLGDTIELSADGGRLVDVVGFIVDPGVRDDLSVVGVDDDLFGLPATTWLAAGQFSRHAELSDLEGRIVATSTSGRLTDLAAQPPSIVASTRYLPVALTVALLAIPLTVVFASRRTASNDVASLCAAGLTARDAWAVVRAGAVSVATAGSVVGAVAAIAASRYSRDLLSGLVDQEWVSIDPSWKWAVGLSIVPTVAAAVGPPVFTVVRRLLAATTRPRAINELSRTSGPALLAVGSAGLIGLSLLRPRANGQLDLAVLALAAIGTGSYLTLQRVANRRSAPGRVAAVTFLQRQFGAASIVVVVIVTLTSTYAAAVTGDARFSRDLPGASQPTGSLLVESVDSDVADQLIELYHNAGGRDVGRYTRTVESGPSLRVTTVALAECATDMNSLDECLQTTGAPLQSIGVADVDDAALSPELGPEAAVILIDSVADRVTLVAIVTASVDENLGGNLPALVLPADRSDLGDFEVATSDSERLAMFDFDRLDSSERAGLLRQIDLLAPASLTAGTESPNAFAMQQSLASTVGIIGAILSALIILVTGASITTANRPYRRTIAVVGAGPAARARLAAQSFGWLAAAVLVVGILTPLAVRSTGRTQGNLGYIWLAPTIAAVTSCAVVVAAFASTAHRSVAD